MPELVQLQHAVSDHRKAVMDKKELFLPVLLLSDIPGLFTCFFLTDSRNFHRKTHIIKSSSLHEQIKMLEDHSYILTLLTEFFFRKFRKILTIHPDSSGCWSFNRFRHRTSVLLPAPERPIMPKISPFSMEKLMFLAASTVLFLWKAFTEVFYLYHRFHLNCSPVPLKYLCYNLFINTPSRIILQLLL